MPGDPYSAPPQRRPFIQEVGASPGRLRIGLMKRSPKGGAPLHPDCVAAVEDVAKLLQSLGHSVEESHPAALDEHEHVHHFGVVVNCHTALALEVPGYTFHVLVTTLGHDPVQTWRFYNSRAECENRISSTWVLWVSLRNTKAARRRRA